MLKQNRHYFWNKHLKIRTKIEQVLDFIQQGSAIIN